MNSRREIVTVRPSSHAVPTFIQFALWLFPLPNWMHRTELQRYQSYMSYHCHIGSGYIQVRSGILQLPAWQLSSSPAKARSRWRSWRTSSSIFQMYVESILVFLKMVFELQGYYLCTLSIYLRPACRNSTKKYVKKMTWRLSGIGKKTWREEWGYPARIPEFPS